ncbi:MAG: segregation and condensation protein segregation and condensation protein [Candidatus Parcubacteria bacterium]|jgi:segregation and condensation protein A
MSFTIKTQVFEGPLDLLLSLVEKRKLFINDIALSKVADDYVEHVKQLGHFPIEDSANFILIASTLLLIKSKSLLPALTLTEDEQQGIQDLETRLKIYQRMKDMSVHVKRMYGESVIYTPTQARPATVVFSPHPSMTSASLLHAIRDIIRNLPKKEVIPKAVIRKVLNLEEVIVSLTERVTAGLRMSFREFTKAHKEEKVNVIVSFLAMLELVKQGVIQVNQEGSFGDIHMETGEVGVPRYT